MAPVYFKISQLIFNEKLSTSKVGVVNLKKYIFLKLEYTHGGRWRPACFLNLLIQVIQLDSKHAAALADTLPQK